MKLVSVFDFYLLSLIDVIADLIDSRVCLDLIFSAPASSELSRLFTLFIASLGGMYSDTKEVPLLKKETS